MYKPPPKAPYKLNKNQIWARLTEAEKELAILRKWFGAESINSLLEQQKMDPDFGEEG